MNKTRIQWTDYTWNPWRGCQKVSDGCRYCYMFRDQERYGNNPKAVVRAADATFKKPLFIVEPSKIFTCSWSDFFIEDADEWRDEAVDIIHQTHRHIYQILTKRPERINIELPENVLLGVSIENQENWHRFDLLEEKSPKTMNWISAEPLIGEYYLTDYPCWVVIGGESGNYFGRYKYRPCEIEWIENLIEDCQSRDIPVFVKQLGTHLAKELGLKDRHGGNIDEWPEHLRIREFPQIAG